MQKWRPRGGAWPPQRGPTITKILKKGIPKNGIFSSPVWERFLTVWWMKRSLSLKVMNTWSKMRSGEGTCHFWRKCVLHRPCRCARHLAPCQNHEKSTKNNANTLKKRSSKNDDPPRAIFNDFGSILKIPGDPKITKKQTKERSKKEVTKRATSRIPPQLTGDGS